MTFYRREGSRLVCLLCAHYCHLKENQIGLCGVNQNLNNAISNLVYGYPIALHVDPIEKKPLYHFLPGTKALSLGTQGCNLSVLFVRTGVFRKKKCFKKTTIFRLSALWN